MWDNNIAVWTEEIAFDGAVSMRGMSRSTIYRWAKVMNKYLEDNKYDWRVKANYAEETIERI